MKLRFMGLCNSFANFSYQFSSLDGFLRFLTSHLIQVFVFYQSGIVAVCRHFGISPYGIISNDLAIFLSQSPLSLPIS